MASTKLIKHLRDKNLIKIFVLLILLFSLPALSFAQDAGAGDNPPEQPPQSDSGTTVETRYATPADQLAAVSCTEAKNIGRAMLLCPAEWALYGSSKALQLSANLFNELLRFSISSDLLRMPLIDDIWELVRNFANLAFILGLIYAAFSLIFSGTKLAFGGASGDTGRLLARLIIIAVLLNFSLFFARFLVDAGNVVSFTFYNAIAQPEIQANGIGQAVGIPDTGVTQKNISGGIMTLFNPARLLGESTFEDFRQSITREGDRQWLTLVYISLAFTVITALAAWEFLLVSIFFVARIIWLMFLMILSPLAFVSWFFPLKINGQDSYFQWWFKQTFARAFCLIPYMFAIYLLIVLGQGFAENGASNSFQGIDGTILLVTLQFFIVYMVLNVARKQTAKLCAGKGAIGGWVSRTSENIIKGTAGAALAGSSRVLGLGTRATVGRAAYDMTNSERLANAAASGGIRGTLADTALYSFGKIGNAKFGTRAGFKDQVSSEGEGVRKRAERISNIYDDQAKQLEVSAAKKVADAKRTQDPQKIALAEAEAKDMIKQAKTMSETGGAQADKYIDNKTKGVGGLFNSAFAGFVPAAQFAKEEREDAKLSKEITNIRAAQKKDEQSEIAARTERDSEIIKQEADRGAEIFIDASINNPEMSTEEILNGEPMADLRAALTEGFTTYQKNPTGGEPIAVIDKTKLDSTMAKLRDDMERVRQTQLEQQEESSEQRADIRAEIESKYGGITDEERNGIKDVLSQTLAEFKTGQEEYTFDDSDVNDQSMIEQLKALGVKVETRTRKVRDEDGKVLTDENGQPRVEKTGESFVSRESINTRISSLDAQRRAAEREYQEKTKSLDKQDEKAENQYRGALRIAERSAVGYMKGNQEARKALITAKTESNLEERRARQQSSEGSGSDIRDRSEFDTNIAD